MLTSDEVIVERLKASVADWQQVVRVDETEALALILSNSFVPVVVDWTTISRTTREMVREVIAERPSGVVIWTLRDLVDRTRETHCETLHGFAEWARRHAVVLQRARLRKFRVGLASDLRTASALPPVILDVLLALLTMEESVHDVEELSRVVRVRRQEIYTAWGLHLGSEAGFTVGDLVDAVLILCVIEAKDVHQGWQYLVKRRFRSSASRMERISVRVFAMEFAELRTSGLETGMERLRKVVLGSASH